MKNLGSVLLVCLAFFLSSQSIALNGQLYRIDTYANIEGLQLYWAADSIEPTSCQQPKVMTMRGNDANAQAMMSMAYTAIAAGYVLSCTPKPGCNGINNTAEVSHCAMVK